MFWSVVLDVLCIYFLFPHRLWNVNNNYTLFYSIENLQREELKHCKTPHFLTLILPDQSWRFQSLPEVEEDRQRDEQRRYGQSMSHNCHVKQDVGRLKKKKKELGLLA